MQLSKASSEERLGFAQKVYGVVGAQVGVTTLMCFTAMKSAAFLSFLATPALMAISFIGIFVIAIMFACSKEMRSSVPKNYVLLFLFTLFEGHNVAIVCAIYDPEIVTLALIITAGVFLVVTGYAISTTKDFTIAWGIILTILVASLFVGIVRIFCNNPGVDLLYCFIGIVSGCFYILYDTQMIFGGHRKEFDLDDYILAALNIYLDIVVLFLRILEFLNKLKEKDKKSKD